LGFSRVKSSSNGSSLVTVMESSLWVAKIPCGLGIDG
jgi:hypothetical protein